MSMEVELYSEECDTKSLFGDLIQQAFAIGLDGLLGKIEGSRERTQNVGPNQRRVGGIFRSGMF